MKNWLIKLFINTLAVLIAAYFLNGIHVDGFKYAFIVALILGVLNASVKPVLLFFTLPFTILTLGVFILFINAAMVKLAAWIIGAGFVVDSWWAAFYFSVIVWLANGILDKTIKPVVIGEAKEPNTKIYDKDGNRIV